MKRHAAALSPEELSIIDAADEGARAGFLNVAAGANPYADPTTPEFQAWEKARFVAQSYKQLRRAA